MFSIKESIKYGWTKFKENKEISLLTTLLLVAVGLLSDGKEMHFGSFLFNLAVIIFMIIIRIGYNKIFLRINDGEKPKFTEIFQEYKIFWRYLGVSILVPLTVLGGLILFIIPGLIWLVRFSFAPIIVIDTSVGPINSMKESYAITKGSFWKLVLFWLVIGLINLLGLILMGVGLLVSIPVSTLAYVQIYRTLTKARAGVSTAV